MPSAIIIGNVYIPAFFYIFVYAFVYVNDYV